MRPGIYGLIFRSTVLTLLLLSSGRVSLAQSGDASCGEKLEQDKREAQLHATMEKLIGIIETKNGPALLKFVDKTGFYVWGGLLSQQDIREEIRRKDGIYCLLFSTDCLASAKFPNGAYVNSSKWTISYSEWLKRHSPAKIEIEMFYGGKDTSCTANVAVRSQQDPRPDQLTFEVGFDYRNGDWKLRSTPAWPEGIALLSTRDGMAQQRIEAPIGNDR